MENLSREITTPIDTYSQDLVVSHIDLLLNYANRFYSRQFITRKPAHSDVLTNLERLLDTYFSDDRLTESGPPSVQYLANQLDFSPEYLGDMLKAHTGQNAEQHCRNHLIEKAKELLATTSLSVGEIAFSCLLNDRKSSAIPKQTAQAALRELSARGLGSFSPNCRFGGPATIPGGCGINGLNTRPERSPEWYYKPV